MYSSRHNLLTLEINEFYKIFQYLLRTIKIPISMLCSLVVFYFAYLFTCELKCVFEPHDGFISVCFV